VNYLESIILGVVQGLTEFLPVSSSGHLQIAKELLGVEIVENLTFDVTLHAATVLSTIVVLRKQIWDLVRGLLRFERNSQTEYIAKIVLSMIPIGIVGFAFKDQLNAMLSSSVIMLIVGEMLLVTAALLTFAARAKEREKSELSWRDAWIIGCAQAVAAMPGLSRSGTTIATGLLLGNKREVVAQFSFLMVILPILGEAFLEIIGGEMTMGAEIGVWPLVAGFVTAFAAGAFACRFMIEIVKRSKLVWFAAYCGIVGIISIISYFA
jgi:undecaprenyl-diphosphatase